MLQFVTSCNKDNDHNIIIYKACLATVSWPADKSPFVVRTIQHKHGRQNRVWLMSINMKLAIIIHRKNIEPYTCTPFICYYLLIREGGGHWCSTLDTKHDTI